MAWNHSYTLIILKDMVEHDICFLFTLSDLVRTYHHINMLQISDFNVFRKIKCCIQY